VVADAAISCYSCGHANRRTARFCRACGASLAAEAGLASTATTGPVVESSPPASMPGISGKAGSSIDRDRSAPSKGIMALVAAVLVAVAGAGGWLVFSHNSSEGKGNHARVAAGRASFGASPSNGPSPLPRPSTATLPAQTADSQVQAIGSLLKLSEATRGKLQPAVSVIQACSSVGSTQLTSSVAAIQDVASARQTQYAMALSLPVTLLPGGSALKASLVAALRYSLQADRDYLGWARQEEDGCFPASDSAAFDAASGADIKAVYAKVRFADMWNSIASEFGQSTVNQADI
jgi:hypothetical protein